MHNAPDSELGGTGWTKMKRTQKNGSPMPQLSGPITQTTARHCATGGMGRTKYEACLLYTSDAADDYSV